jgi:hypothetical protein
VKPADPRVTAARKLSTLADELQRGASFPITRLTVLQRLCAEWENAAPFACYLAELSRSHFRAAPPGRLDAGRVHEFETRIDAAVACIHSYLAKPTRDAELALRAARWDLESAQDETRDTRWATVRTIHSRDALGWRTRSTASSIRATPPRGDTDWAATTQSATTHATGPDWYRNPHRSCVTSRISGSTLLYRPWGTPTGG